jgi:Tol biopolymer transport system component
MKKSIFIGLLLLGPIALMAQYFGRNKVSYEKFPFKVLETPHFEIHHYLEDMALTKYWGHQSECWYASHQNLLWDTLGRKNPLILYNNHADFQQTRAISGRISIGTGGVTEALKNRVLMPFTMSYQQSNHVLGHELVHAFQYNMILRGDSTNLSNLANLPLWMVEGMAEYLSIGRIDPHTAMWMRDAYLQERLPSIRDLNNYSKFFPYRYGQLFWSYMTGRYGDEIMNPLFISTAKVGLNRALDSLLGIREPELSQEWLAHLNDYYGWQLLGRSEAPIGQQLISEKNAGRMNLSPALSPNGRYLIFYSEKDLFSVDLFLAEARTGRILRKVASTLKDQQIDDFQYIESSGSWSPDGTRFVFVTIQKGQNYLMIKDVFSGKTADAIRLKEVPAIANPAWSPDGKSILFSGLVKGQTDLFLLDLQSREVMQLTNDTYSEIQASWSADGQTIVFASDRWSRENRRTHGKWTFNLAVLDLPTRTQRQLAVFLTANNLNPRFNADGQIVFLSDRDGFRNIYRYDLITEELVQMTDLLTGVSGITAFAPALDIGKNGKELVYIHYFDQQYTIYKAGIDEFLNIKVPADAVDFTPAILPYYDPERPDSVLDNLEAMEKRPSLPDSAYAEKKYRPRFKLDYVGGGGGVGIGTNSSFGNTAYLTGGVEMLFSDMLGYHQLYTVVSLNGEIVDFGAMVAYINQKHRLPWGITISHIPYRGGFSYWPVIDTLNDEYLAIRQSYDIIRIFEDQAGVFAYWPFSQILRAEVGASVARYSYRVDRYDNYYDMGGYFMGTDRYRLEAPDGFGLVNMHFAFVGDNSYFGLASPMQGHRFRVGMDQYWGEWEYKNFVLDARKYYWLSPVSLAFRVMHVARIGPDATAVTPMYVGDPLLVRGYGFDYDRIERHNLTYNQLQGSKVAVVNAEVRLPFTGPKRLAMIPSQSIFSELTLFFDGGGAWNKWSDFQTDPDPLFEEHKWIFSTGISWRLNMMGAAVIEPYYAFPLQEKVRGTLGVNIMMSGW